MLLKLKNKLVMVLAIVCASLMLTGTVLWFGNNSANALSGALDSNTAAVLQDTYVVGEKLSVPSGKITYNGSTYNADEVLLYTPDGKVISVTEYTFDVIGKYTLVYSAKVDGKYVTAEKKFNVNKLNYSADATKVQNVNYLSTLSQTAGSANKTAGLNVSIPMGDAFTWNTAIDLRETAKDTPVISFLPFQYTQAKSVNGLIKEQATDIYVRLTDAYDPSIYVEFLLRYFLDKDKANQMPSYTAGANGQPKMAIDENVGRTSTDGKVKTFYDPDLTDGNASKQYYVSWEEFPGYPTVGLCKEGGVLIDLYYDVENQQALVSQETGAAVFDKVIINDLNTTTNYRDNIFNGFTTGEVYLSIYAEKYQPTFSAVDIDIAAIGGVSGTDLFQEKAEDNKAPVIELSASKKQIQNGLYVVQGKRVDILPAEVYDVNLKSFTTHVTYQGASVAVSNNSFVPNNLGDYTVTYTAEDTFGNVTTRELIYKSVDRSNNNNSLFVVDLNEDLLPDGIKAGYKLVLPEYSITSNNNFVEVSIFAYLKGDMSTKIEVNPETRELFVENAGDYVVVFQAKDIFEEITTEYTFESTTSDNVLWTTPSLPKYFITGAKYTLDPVYAQSFSSKYSQMNEATYEMKSDAGNFVKVDYGNFKVTATNTVQFRYTFAGKTFLSDVIPVVNVLYSESTMDITSYFQGNFTAEPVGDKNFALLANANSGNVVVDFVNAISLSSLELNFVIPANMSNFTSVRFILTDYLDRNNSVYVEYAADGTGFIFNINGGASLSLKKPFVGTTFNTKYNFATSDFSDVNLESTLPWTNMFKGDRALLSVEICGITGRAGISFNSINGVNMTRTGKDNTKPNIGYDSSFAGPQAVNTIVTLSSAEGSDVLSPTYYGANNIKLTVIDLEGNSVADINGVLLENVDARQSYQLALRNVGEYIVSYSYKDQKSNNNVIFGFYSIYAEDRVKPTIVIDGGYSELVVDKANIGDVITAKNYTVSDNSDNTAQLVVNVFVIDPFYGMFDLIQNSIEIEDMKFVCEYRGVYTVYYYAEDTSGNISSASYKIFVN